MSTEFRKWVRISTVLLGGAMIALPVSAWAETAQDQGIETVVVTASKRAEKLQDVPMGISALTGDALQRINAVNFADFVSRIPGLASSAGDPGHTQLILRGINAGGIGATVGIYIDETPYGSSNALSNGFQTTPNIDTFDMARVEVLRGPQGTLYGANTLGGLLKFVTNAPDPSGFDNKMQVGVENVAHGGTGWSARGMLNIPLADNLAVRGTIYHTKTAGFIDDPVRGKKDVNGSDETGGRLSLLWHPTNDLSIRLTGLAQNLDLNGNYAVDGTYVPSASTPSGLAISPIPAFGDYEQARTTSEFSNVHYRLYNGTVDYDLGFGTLTSASSYGTFSDSYMSDATGIYGTLIRGHLNQKKFTQEVRLASPSDQPLEWLAGFYYTHETSRILQELVLTPKGAAVGALTLKSSYAETAGFANVTYHFSPSFDISAGGRYAGNSQHANQFGLAVAGGESSENVFTWAVAPSWHVTPNAMIYARIAKGYQPGGPNALPPSPPASVPASFKSDTLINYELGFKGTLADGRLTLDADAFYIDWNSIQLLTVVGGFGVNGNGGTATSKGFEWSVSWLPVDGLNLRFNGAYVDAKLTADTDPLLLGAVSGDPLPYVPNWSASLDGDYHFMPVGDFAPFVGASWRYTGKRYSGFDASYGQTRLPSYSQFDLRAGVDHGNWSFDVYVKNVADKRGISQSGTGGSAASGVAPLINITEPRVIGVTLTGKI